MSTTADGIKDRVQAVLDERVASGAEVGVQVAVVAGGELVVDAVSGLTDPRPGHGDAVTPGTLFFAASTAKGIASAVAHVLVERGELAYDRPVVDVWPELGAHGKSGITLRHVLMHTAGVPAPPSGTTVEELCDWGHMCAALADARPWWAPGAAFGYHAVTFGFLLGEVVRRATGRTLTWWLREAVTGPLGVEDEVHFGVPDALSAGWPARCPRPGRCPNHRRARPPPGPCRPASGPTPRYANRRDVLSADIPSQGTMSARGAALAYAGLLGLVPGVALVSADRLTDMAEVKYRGPDEVMGMDTAWAFGFSTYRPSGTSRDGSTFGMVGMNGSAAYADIDSGVAVAVMRNRFDPTDPTVMEEVDRLVAAAWPPSR